ncbi:MAG: MCE family protein [Verrucomicrobia bacterium]|nr:MCE family protein [Verrucomicrobiota bacterium]
MTESAPIASHPASPPPPVAPVRRPRRGGLSPVWIVPFIAAALGLWLAWRYYSAKGPEIAVRFDTAEGIIAGKTPVLCRSVNVGTVGEVRLTDDLKGVVVKLDMNSDASRLLVDDTQIWIVRARYSAAGISGLNTLFSGNYLELQPGISKAPRREFTGLENPPATPPGVPGLRFRLLAKQAGGLGPGASIIYKGIGVGKVETRTFHPENGEVEFSAFIEKEYARLVDETTRFFNAGGLDLKIGADGVQLRSGTLESLLASSVTFTEPDSNKPRAQVLPDGHTFILYGSFDETRKADFNPSLPYLLLFTGSVRGLSVDAPVEFRGIRVGTVISASFQYYPDDPERRVPVLIKLDPTLLVASGENDPTTAQRLIAQSVEKGLRASLKTGSFLTGQLFVELDFQKDAPPAEVVSIPGYDVLPTISSGLEELQEKLATLLDKFNDLPLDKTVDSANQALLAVKDAAANLSKFLGSSETQALPGSLRKDLTELQRTLAGYNDKSPFYQDLSATLRQLTETLRALQGLSGTLDRNPNSIIFGKPGNVAPPRGSR